MLEETWLSEWYKLKQAERKKKSSQTASVSQVYRITTQGVNFDSAFYFFFFFIF
ncbi:MAG: hypothetical protein K6253_01030 [Candidatus Liberibacter asiaticus]|nr:hypothetical protein [Candidatus Liberibacter asiaticus]